MKFVLVLFFFLLSLFGFSQSSGKKAKAKPQRIAVSKPVSVPPAKSAYVVITSDKDSSATKNTWEGEWTAYVEEQAREIAMKVLLKDSTRMIYKVMIGFSVKENGSLANLAVTCMPKNDFIVKECMRMASDAPKKKSLYREGQYVKMNVQQPVEINVK